MVSRELCARYCDGMGGVLGHTMRASCRANFLHVHRVFYFLMLPLRQNSLNFNPRAYLDNSPYAILVQGHMAFFKFNSLSFKLRAHLDN
jgi:hypothetical protein